MEMSLVLPNNYVELEQEEMMCLDGGWGVPTWVVTGATTVAINAALFALGGKVATTGLRIVLGSYSIRSAVVSGIIKGLGVLGIKLDNAMVHKYVWMFASGGVSSFVNGFANMLDRNDGKEDGWISW